MANSLRIRPGRGLSGIDAMLESLRDYTYQTEELARLIERQRSRIVLVGYLLFSYLLLAATISFYIWSRIESHDATLRIILGAFAAITFVGMPSIVVSAINRYFQYKNDLLRSISRLSDTMRFISQVREHVEGDRIEAAVLELRLKEADSVLEHAERVVRSRMTEA